MSKQDYITIARVLAASFVTACPVGKGVIWTTTLSLADALQADNARFDRSRFYEAVLGSADHFAVRDSFQVAS